MENRETQTFIHVTPCEYTRMINVINTLTVQNKLLVKNNELTETTESTERQPIMKIELFDLTVDEVTSLYYHIEDLFINRNNMQILTTKE